jgi:hypothetical protein
VLREHRRDLHQAVADVAARLLELLLVVALQRVDVAEELLLEAVEEKARAGPHHRIGRHQLRVRKALVDVLVDDVGLVEDEVALDQHGHLVVRDSSPRGPRACGRGRRR